MGGLCSWLTVGVHDKPAPRHEILSRVNSVTLCKSWPVSLRLLCFESYNPKSNGAVSVEVVV